MKNCICANNYKNQLTLNFVTNPPMGEASRQVANLTERKNLHAPLYGVEEFVYDTMTEQDFLLPRLVRANQKMNHSDSELRSSLNIKHAWHMPYGSQMYRQSPIFLKQSV